MSEKEMTTLYELLEKIGDENQAAALRHAIFILENSEE